MATITDIDYGKLIRWLLPVRLRKARMIAFLTVGFWYIKQLYSGFKVWETKTWYDLKYQSGQVAHLEYVLNDRFDPVQKRIYISGGLYPTAVYLYLDSEDQPLYLYSEVENQPVYLYNDTEYLYGFADFVINVPYGLPNSENFLSAVADRYKRDSKNYVINYF